MNIVFKADDEPDDKSFVKDIFIVENIWLKLQGGIFSINEVVMELKQGRTAAELKFVFSTIILPAHCNCWKLSLDNGMNWGDYKWKLVPCHFYLCVRNSYSVFWKFLRNKWLNVRSPPRREHHVDCFAISTRNRNPDFDGRGQGFEVGGNQLVKAEKDILPAGQHDELWEMWPKLL